jgi:hypothetical protein
MQAAFLPSRGNGEDLGRIRRRSGLDLGWIQRQARFEAEAEAEAVDADSSVLWVEERRALRIRRPSRPSICSQDREQGSEPYYDTTAGRAAVRTLTSSPATVSNDSGSSWYTPPLRLPAPTRFLSLCSRRVHVRDLCALRRSFSDPRRRVPWSPGHGVDSRVLVVSLFAVDAWLGTRKVLGKAVC